jgi:hypothetical protein
VIQVVCNQNYFVENDCLVFEVNANNSATLELEFKAKVEIKEDVNKEKYFSYGALFYAKSINALELTGKTYYKQFTDITYKPIENARFQYIEEHNARFNAGKIMVHAKNKNTNQIETITLIPFGKTILRQVSF